jgi:hypothetical protein
MKRSLFLLFFVVVGFPGHAETSPLEARIEIGNKKISQFDPRHALGAGLDGHWEGETAGMLSPASIRQMLKAGLGPISVRLRTELAVEAWHWNPQGRWSDARHREGYWTSDSMPETAKPILTSYGYKLPRRGNTFDEANDDGFSMLDDGDLKTFWKSNPYLTHSYTGEADAQHPQWVVLDFGKPVEINSLMLRWAEPYAKHFVVEYATAGRVYFGGHPWNVWHIFPHGVVTNGKGGEQFLQFGKKPLMVRYLRIWMTESSCTAPKGSVDPRDAMGYAIREIGTGYADQFSFDDHVIHSPGKGQTTTYTSSTDPWHRERDRDPKVEQPGIDLVFRSGVTRGLPVMLPVPVFYDTPENVGALADYVGKSKYPVGRWELGEEPDGQRVDPRDFGTLYAQSARAIRSKIPSAVMGGPSFVTADVQPDDTTYRCDKNWWIRDFFKELKRRGQNRDLQFLSFEWYPFDDVNGSEKLQLPQASSMLEKAMSRLAKYGLPLVIGEFNYSVFPCRQEVDLAGALLNAETAAQFLCRGGDAAYYYGYEPNKLEQTAGSWGNQIMLLRGKGEIEATPVATFHAMRLVAREWLDPNGGQHTVLPVHLLGIKEPSLVSAFAVKRPDGSRSLLVINKDPKKPVNVSLSGLSKSPHRFTSYSCSEYAWQPDGSQGHPSRNLAASTRSIPFDRSVSIPPWSIAVIR